MRRTAILALLGSLALWLVAGAAAASTLADVRKHGAVRCGVHTGLLGFAAEETPGEWSGFDVDYCRAVAVAIFNDAKAVDFVPLIAKDRFDALKDGEVDLLARNTTWTMTRDTTQGLIFAGINYFDGQGFMLRKSQGISSALELSGAKICVHSATTTELNLADFFNLQRMEYKLFAYDDVEEVKAAYESGLCTAYSADASSLYSIRLSLARPDEHMILPDIISKEPLGMVVRQDDIQWFNIVKWVHFALLNAEELGVTRANVDEMRDSPNQAIRRLLGTDGSFGEGIGLTNDWAYNVIKTLGNYDEIFQRNIGAGSRLEIARGLNALWIDRGIQYAPPIR